MPDMIIEQIPAYHIVYIRRVGPYGGENKGTMDALKNWARANGLFDDGTVILGIAQDNPEWVAPECCRYDTCVVVPDGYPVTCGLVTDGSIAGGKYAVFAVRHTAEAVREAWACIFSEVTRQGYQFDGARPVIERYQARMVQNHFCELCVPVH
jgi:DNA gyrase inhibitor GyrI